MRGQICASSLRETRKLSETYLVQMKGRMRRAELEIDVKRAHVATFLRRWKAPKENQVLASHSGIRDGLEGGQSE